MPIAAQSTTPSGSTTNSGSATNKLACCNDQCAAASWQSGKGTDVAAAGTTKAKLYCGLNRMPVASQSAKDSTVDTISQVTAVNNACCDDICSKVTFSAGKGTDVTTSGSENYFCGENKVQQQIKQPEPVVLILLVLVTRMHAVMTLAARSLSRLARALMRPVPRPTTAVRTRCQLPSKPLSHQAVMPLVLERREHAVQLLAAQ